MIAKHCRRYLLLFCRAVTEISEFFALDTNEISVAQTLWLKDELEKSRARWKLVYGHHPIYSAGTHGDNNGLIRTLLPLLPCSQKAYMDSQFWRRIRPSSKFPSSARTVF